jgi:uncharacterized protein (TIGR02246 family)
MALIVGSVAPVFAGGADPGKAVSDSFGKACSSGDVPAVMKLYEDDATVIWPGQGEVAKGKADIEKLVKDQCKPSSPKLSLISQESKKIGDDYIVNLGRWETTVPGPDGKPSAVQVRTTELLHHSGGQWRYAIDHASIGLPPPPAQKTASH